MARRTRIIVLTVIVATVSLAATIIASTVGGNTGTVGGNNGSLNLPRIAWEGGPAYWDQFPVAKAAGWGNQDFFPIAIWYDGVSSNAEVRADESYGINTYIGEP